MNLFALTRTDERKFRRTSFYRNRSAAIRELWEYWVYWVERGNRTYDARGQENHFSEISFLSLYRAISVSSVSSVSIRFPRRFYVGQLHTRQRPPPGVRRARPRAPQIFHLSSFIIHHLFSCNCLQTPKLYVIFISERKKR